MLCHCAEVPKDFRCCNHRLCFPYCDWHLESFPQKARSPRDRLNVVRPSPLRWGLGTRLSIPSHFTHHHWPILPGLSIPSHFTHITDWSSRPKHSKLISLTITDWSSRAQPFQADFTHRHWPSPVQTYHCASSIPTLFNWILLVSIQFSLFGFNCSVIDITMYSMISLFINFQESISLLLWTSCIQNLCFTYKFWLCTHEEPL